MPLYTFYCSNCNKQYDIQMKLTEHSEQKDKLQCQECNEFLTQQVAPLRFKLKGNGWFDQDYAITSMETNSNLDLEKRIEGRFHDANGKDSNVKEL